MKQLRHMWFIAMKDFRLFITDKTAFFMFVLFPLIFITMFSLTPGESEDTRLELHLVTKEAPGGISWQIIDNVRTKKGEQLKPGEPKVIWDKDYEKARDRVENGRLAGFLLFPTDFSEKLEKGKNARLRVIANAEQADTRAALIGLAEAMSARVGSEHVGYSALARLTPGQVPPLAPDDPKTKYIDFQTEQIGQIQAENASNFVVSGYLVMFVFLAGAFSAEMIVRERQNLTLERLLASSVRRESILGGIFFGTTLKGLLQISIFWVIGVAVFQADIGRSPGAIVLLSIMMVVMSAAFGLMLATFMKTQSSANSAALLASLSLAPLGGSWWPLFITPLWMQAIAKTTPHAWANTGFNKLMLFGGDFYSVVPEILALVGFTVVFGAIAVWRFKLSAIPAD